MDITNKTTKPISIPLPGGKKLFLAPRKTGQINPKALSHPPLAKLIEAGDLETSDLKGKHSTAGTSNTSNSTTTTVKSTGAMRQSGDR